MTLRIYPLGRKDIRQRRAKRGNSSSSLTMFLLYLMANDRCNKILLTIGSSDEHDQTSSLVRMNANDDILKQQEKLKVWLKFVIEYNEKARFDCLSRKKPNLLLC